VNFTDGLSKNSQISSFIEVRPVGAELFHAEEQSIRYDETNITFSLFCERPYVPTYYKATACFMYVKLVLCLVMCLSFYWARSQNCDSEY